MGFNFLGLDDGWWLHRDHQQLKSRRKIDQILNMYLKI